MRLACPVCGERDLREFTYRGAASLLDRPSEGADAMDAYLHSRKNQAGPHAELWQHELGCRAWLRVERHTVTHEVFGTAPAREAER